MRNAASTRSSILEAAQDLVLQHGFSATTVDAVIGVAGISKGAFFHHFPSKQALGRSLLERYAAADIEMLEAFMVRAEAETDDPARQLLSFIRAFEDASDELFSEPGCLFVSFVYEQAHDRPEANEIIGNNIELWRRRLGEKLSQALAERSPSVKTDVESVADLMFTVFEGSFILARATGDPSHVRRQLGHYRRYLELLLDGSSSI